MSKTICINDKEVLLEPSNFIEIRKEDVQKSPSEKKSHSEVNELIDSLATVKIKIGSEITSPFVNDSARDIFFKYMSQKLLRSDRVEKKAIDVIELVHDESTLPDDNELVWLRVRSKRNGNRTQKKLAVFNAKELCFILISTDQRMALEEIIAWSK
jgi:hypothetical protein